MVYFLHSANSAVYSLSHSFTSKQLSFTTIYTVFSTYKYTNNASYCNVTFARLLTNKRYEKFHTNKKKLLNYYGKSMLCLRINFCSYLFKMVLGLVLLCQFFALLWYSSSYIDKNMLLLFIRKIYTVISMRFLSLPHSSLHIFLTAWSVCIWITVWRLVRYR